MSMELFADIALVILFMSLLFIPVKKPEEYPPYFRKKSLLNETEQALFIRLTEAMPDHHVLAKVRLADIVGVKKCEKWQEWLDKINRKSVDFAICNLSFEVLACIEIDWKSPDQENRQKTDTGKGEALKAAGIPVLLIEANEMPSAEGIKTMLEKAQYIPGRRICEVTA